MEPSWILIIQALQIQNTEPAENTSRISLSTTNTDSRCRTSNIPQRKSQLGERFSGSWLLCIRHTHARNITMCFLCWCRIADIEKTTFPSWKTYLTFWKVRKIKSIVLLGLLFLYQITSVLTFTHLEKSIPLSFRGSYWIFTYKWYKWRYLHQKSDSTLRENLNSIIDNNTCLSFVYHNMFCIP